MPDSDFTRTWRLKYDKICGAYHSGPDCSDGDVWRENDPVKEVPEGPPPIAN